ncbi:hypothetical protein RCL1_000786 [Eukaryota sp. TZLM3-RCL]
MLSAEIKCYASSSMTFELTSNTSNVDVPNSSLTSLEPLSDFSVLGKVNLRNNFLVTESLSALNQTTILWLDLTDNYSLPPFKDLVKHLPTVWILNDIYITLSEKPFYEQTVHKSKDKLISSDLSTFQRFKHGPPTTLAHDRMRLKTVTDFYFSSSISSVSFTGIPCLKRIDLGILFSLLARNLFSPSAASQLLDYFIPSFSPILVNLPAFVFNYFASLIYSSLSQSVVSTYLKKKTIEFFECISIFKIPLTCLDDLIVFGALHVFSLIPSNLEVLRTAKRELAVLAGLEQEIPQSTLEFKGLLEKSIKIDGFVIKIGDTVRLSKCGNVEGVIKELLSFENHFYFELLVNNFDPLVVLNSSFSPNSRVVIPCQDLLIYAGTVILKSKTRPFQLLSSINLYTESRSPSFFLVSSDSFVNKIPGRWIPCTPPLLTSKKPITPVFNPSSAPTTSMFITQNDEDSWDTTENLFRCKSPVHTEDERDFVEQNS